MTRLGPGTGWLAWAARCLVAAAAWSWVHGGAASASAELAVAAPPSSGALRVARLNYAGGKDSACFSEGFLSDTARHTGLDLARELAVVNLDSAELFDFPMVILSSEGPFTLAPAEIDHLRRYLAGGGFVLASAGCSSPPWSASFRAAMEQVLAGHSAAAPRGQLEPIGREHPLFSTLFELRDLRTRQVSDEAALLYGLEIEGRLAVVFSPLGLNDTDHAGGGCCCCGGNEIVQARLLNANVLAYVLLH